MLDTRRLWTLCSKQVKEYAPKIHVFSIKPEKIKDVIGKGGEMIDKIIEQCDNIKIDFEDDGTCFLTHSNQAIIEKAKNLILLYERHFMYGIFGKFTNILWFTMRAINSLSS